MEISNIYNQDIISRYTKDVRKYPKLTSEENKQLMRKYLETQDEKIITKLIEGNLRLTILIAKKFINLFPLENCIEIANETICKTIRNYNPDKGNMSTFLLKSITLAMLSARDMNETSFIKTNTYQRYNADFIEPNFISTEKTIPETENITVGDTLISGDTSEFEFPSDIKDIIWDAAYNECINPSIKRRGRLSEGDGMMQPYHVLKAIFAEKPYKMSTDEIGEIYNTSRQNINQIKKTILNRLKNNPKLKKIWQESLL